jgi:hypothetical protein
VSAPTFPLVTTTPASGPGVTLALTQDVDPDNPVIGDLHLQNGQIHLWDKRAARRQKVRMVLQFGLGEFWLNPDEGIPYFNQIIGTKRKGAVLGIFRQAFIRTMPDLAEIRTLTLDFDPVTRAAAVGFDLRFDDGMIINSADFSPLELGI